eukprot:CAMPEP_0119015320 /NCGR_PEP_ID=MMETSP1176-20130426/10811_1 /TAXON_ID=265551 /ORGANISM="Synedropsis recta cf, Strain CCMP1620" /LENGTH=69 /DNA_ID=CAMNT_0006968603 /DNA_START=38 /DNA_END=247 /DNA_ORIENTATION=+
MELIMPQAALDPTVIEDAGVCLDETRCGEPQPELPRAEAVPSDIVDPFAHFNETRCEEPQSAFPDPWVS